MCSSTVARNDGFCIFVRSVNKLFQPLLSYARFTGVDVVPTSGGRVATKTVLRQGRLDGGTQPTRCGRSRRGDGPLVIVPPRRRRGREEARPANKAQVREGGLDLVRQTRELFRGSRGGEPRFLVPSSEGGRGSHGREVVQQGGVERGAARCPLF